jgi:hypothetical protein
VGGQSSTTDVDDDYLRWQEEIRLAKEEAEALKAGRTHRYHKDFQKHVEFAEEPMSLLLLLKLETRRGRLLLLKVNKNSLMMTGLCTSWDHVLKAWVPQVS